MCVQGAITKMLLLGRSESILLLLRCCQLLNGEMTGPLEQLKHKIFVNITSPITKHLPFYVLLCIYHANCRNITLNSHSAIIFSTLGSFLPKLPP